MDLEVLIAARSGDIEKTIQLADRAKRNIDDQTTPEGNTILHMAARFGHSQLVGKIIERHPSLVRRSNLKGQTPLHMAARAGKVDVVKSLIESVRTFSRLHIAGIQDKYGNTPLHDAVRNGSFEVVKALADDDKESLLLINDAGESPLSIAIDRRCTKIAKDIIFWNKFALEFVGRNGQTALHYAVIRDDSDTMDLILKLKEDLVGVQDQHMRTPLHYAAALGHETMVNKLLQIDPLVARRKDKNQQTPVHMAAKNGQRSLIEKLLDNCPDTIEIVDNKQRNILHLAAESGNLDVVSYILKLDEMEVLVNSPDADGNTPLHLATSNCYSDVVGVLSKNPEVEIRAINKFNKTALAIVKSSDGRGMEIRKYLTLKALRRAYMQKKAIHPDEILQNLESDDVVVEMEIKDGYKGGRQAAQIILVMSTLIATFTFTAAFTIPGGFNSGCTGTNSTNSADEGMATLIGKSAFQAFVIFDAIAMTSSITAAVIVFWSTLLPDGESFMDILLAAICLTGISLAAITVAFVTGLFAVLQHKLWLAILVCIIGYCHSVNIYAKSYLAFAPVSNSQTSVFNRRNRVEDKPLGFFFQLMSTFVQRRAPNLHNRLRLLLS